MMKIDFWERTSVNVVTNVLRTLVMALIGLFLTPYYLSELGASVYAIIPLATTISSYVLIISDALIDSCGRYVSLTIRKKNAEESVTVYSTAIRGVIRVCLIFLPVCLAISYLSPAVFNVPDGVQTDVQIMFALVLTSSLIVSVSSVLSSLFLAHNEMYLVHLSRLIYTVAQVAIIVVLFSIGTPNLIDIGTAYLLSSVILVASLMVFAKRLPDKPRFSPRCYDRELFRSISNLSAWAVIAKLGSLLYIELSLVLVNLYLGEEPEAGFAILSTMMSMIGTAVTSVSSCIEPLLYRLYGEGRERDLVEIVHVGEKIFGFTMAMPIAFLMAFGSNVLTAWVGENYLYIGSLLMAACIGYLIHCCEKATSVLPILYLRNRLIAAVVVAFGVVNCVAACAVLSFTDWGLPGVTGVWALCLFLEELAYLLICMKISHAGTTDYLLPVLETYGICGACYAVFWVIAKYVDIGSTWLTVIPAFAVMFAVYLAVMFRFLLSKRDVSLVSGVLPGILKRFAVRFSKCRCRCPVHRERSRTADFRHKRIVTVRDSDVRRIRRSS